MIIGERRFSRPLDFRANPPSRWANRRGSEKKAARAAALAAEKERVAHVKSVASIAEPLADFAPFVKAAKAKFGTEIEHYTAASMPETEHQFCFELLKRNMKQMRLDAVDGAGVPWGWKEAEEKATLRGEDALFLLLRPAAAAAPADGSPTSVVAPEPAAPTGFVMFKWELEGDCTVLYVYELQLAPAARGNGLGKFVMQLLELMATKHKMQFMMLTVFKINDGAMRFYLDKLKYSVDETSPSRCAVDDESSYEILSKCLDKSLIENAKQDADDLGPRLRS